MKKLFLLSVLTVFSVISVKAQADSELVQIGVKGGVNFANFTGDDFGDADSRTSFHAGIVAEIPFSERFSVQPEVYYSGQGFDIAQPDQDNFLDNDDNLEYQLDYIQIPILIKIYLIEGLNIQAGPQIGFLINDEIDFDTTSDDGDIDNPSDIWGVPEPEDIDFSLAAGLEYKLRNGFFLQGRYNYGFTELFSDSDIHNSVWQVGVGYMF